MTEEERLNRINGSVAKHVKDILLQLHNEELTYDDFIALTYGCMVVADIIGYSVHDLADDAIAGSKKLSVLVSESVLENEAED